MVCSHWKHVSCMPCSSLTQLSTFQTATGHLGGTLTPSPCIWLTTLSPGDKTGVMSEWPRPCVVQNARWTTTWLSLNSTSALNPNDDHKEENHLWGSTQASWTWAPLQASWMKTSSKHLQMPTLEEMLKRIELPSKVVSTLLPLSLLALQQVKPRLICWNDKEIKVLLQEKHNLHRSY